MVTDVADQGAVFSITDTKLYVAAVTLSTQDNAKLFAHLKSGFKKTSNWNKYKSKLLTKRQNQYLDYLIDSGSQGVNKTFCFNIWKRSIMSKL